MSPSRMLIPGSLPPEESVCESGAGLGIRLHHEPSRRYHSREPRTRFLSNLLPEGQALAAMASCAPPNRKSQVQQIYLVNKKDDS